MPKVKFIALAKNYKTVVEQLEVLPEKCFRTYLYITDCTAHLRTIVIKLLDSCKLIGIIANDEKTPEEQIILHYASRCWLYLSIST